jgi:hypothetical protein
MCGLTPQDRPSMCNWERRYSARIAPPAAAANQPCGVERHVRDHRGNVAGHRTGSRSVRGARTDAASDGHASGKRSRGDHHKAAPAGPAAPRRGSQEKPLAAMQGPWAAPCCFRSRDEHSSLRRRAPSRPC